MKRETYIFVRKGLVQHCIIEHNGEPTEVLPIAETHEDALRLARRWMSQPPFRQGIRPARIGSVQGETLEGHIALALSGGCKLCCCVAGWNPDGSPQWKYLDLNPSDDPEVYTDAAEDVRNVRIVNALTRWLGSVNNSVPAAIPIVCKLFERNLSGHVEFELLNPAVAHPADDRCLVLFDDPSDCEQAGDDWSEDGDDRCAWNALVEAGLISKLDGRTGWLLTA